MKVLRAHIKGWTSSFRYPGFAVAVHPTLPMPPLSTLFGLLSAARGRPVTPQETAIGFVFRSEGKAVDLETIYEIESLVAKSNVVQREVLYAPELFLYTSDLSFANDWRRPQYPLVLGRSTELVQVVEVCEVELEQREDARIGFSLLPFSPRLSVAGSMHALPTHFTTDLPRRAVGTRPWLMLESWQRSPVPVWCDTQNDWAVWMHGIDHADQSTLGP
jgi:CRISPR-associated protein Cas5t